MTKINKPAIMLFASCLWTNFVFGQTTLGNLQWSAVHKLTVEDFAIKTNSLETAPSFAQFSLNYEVNGFDFLTKNFNKKVHNYLIRDASSIDTTTNINLELLYQQTLFDIAEIYARQFRKALRENRKQLLKGTKIAEELNDKIMAEFSKRRIDYDRETKSGTDLAKQKEWENQIQKELLELEGFEYDK